MDSVDLFRIFLRVAENGSFVRAAELLNRPASTVSAAVQELELRLGTRLFHRTTRSVSLTIDGNAFMRVARLPFSISKRRKIFSGIPAAK
jgi:DNA-binding transcriptional LysR family regulator